MQSVRYRASDCRQLLNSLENLLQTANSQGHQEAEKFFQEHSEEFQNKLPSVGMSFKHYDSFNERIVIDLFRDHAFQTDAIVKRCECLKERGENVEYLGVYKENETFFELMYSKSRQMYMKLAHIWIPGNVEKSMHLKFTKDDDLGILEARARHELLHYLNASDEFRIKLTWMMSYIQSARIDDINISYRTFKDPLNWVDELNQK
jgi:hypothetical protein